jgi:hypothetical protein
MIKNEFRACYLRNRQDIMHFANMSRSIEIRNLKILNRLVSTSINLIKSSEAKLRSLKHLHMLHQTTNTNTLHGDHMIEIMKASTFEFCGLLRSVKYYLR